MNKYITLFIGISVVISLIYIAGYKKNIKIMKRMAETLEKAFKIEDQVYTYLGGVLGFSADYKLKKLKQIKAVLRLIPRQSALYLPFMFLTSGRDSLQIMFYLKRPIKEEFHIIKKNFLNFSKPKIYNRDKLQSEVVDIDGVKYELLYEKGLSESRDFLNFIQVFNQKHFNHLAATKENNIIYVNLLFYNMNYENLTNSLKKFCIAVENYK